MIKDIVQYAVLSLLVFPSVAAAQLESGPNTANPNSTQPTAPQGKVGFVDIELVIEQSKAIRMAMDSMDQVMAGKARTIDTKEREFRRTRFEADRQERVLSTDERERKRLELIALQEEIEKLKFEFDSELRVRERQIEPVLEHIMRLVADVADEQGFDIVLRGEVIIYGRSSVDLTIPVIEKLDANVAGVMKLFKDAAASTGVQETTVPQTTFPTNTTPRSPLQPIEETTPKSSDAVIPLVPQ
ncbi:MAG: OmpH family outer membrane protein [Sumerlaeia bacterium]